MKTKKVKFFLSLVGVIVFAIAAGVVVRVLATGPTGSAGSGYGAISTDAYGDVGVGTSTIPSSNPSPGRVFIVATSTVPYTIEILPVSGVTPNFKIDNSGNVTAATFVGALNGTVGANNVSNGVFGAGNFGFPSSLGVATSSQVGLPQSLSVYGGGYFSGSVGIGTPGPDSLLHVNGGQIDITGSTFGSGSGLTLGYVSGTNGYIQTYASKPLYINPLGNNVILNSGGGSVGIGTTGPGYKLDVQGGQINASGGYCINGANCITSWPSGNVGTVTSITAGTGLSGGTITGSGTVAVTYGATAGTAAQGNVTHTGPAAGAGLSGGGGVLAVGTTGTFNTISLNLSSANTWTAYQTFSSGLSATAIIDSVLPSQNCIGTSGIGQLEAGVCGATAVSAGNITSGVFGALQGNGNFAFPANLGVNTASQVGLPQALSVYGGGYISGNVGIGTSAPATKLQVDSGDIAFTYGSNYNSAGGRYGGKLSALANMSGRQVNDNPDFMKGLVDYSVYDNGGSGSVTLSLYSDSTAPSGSGRVMQITHTNTGSPSPGFGGFYKANTLCGTSAVGPCLRQGDRNVIRIWANIPSGYTINYATNSMGSGGNFQWISPTAGTGAYEEYIGVESLGSGASSVNFFYITGPSRPFTWYVASMDMIDVDLPADVDRASTLNVGYQNDVNLGTGSMLTTAATYLATGGGNVGIGTTGPGYKLDVQGGQINSSGGYCINGANCITSWPTGFNPIGGIPLNAWMYASGAGVRNWYVGPSDMYWEIGGSGSFHFRNSGDADVATINYAGGLTDTGEQVNGTVNVTGNTVAYGFQGNGNVGGTGSAAWFPSGLYSAGTNWIYGSTNINGAITDTSNRMQMNPGGTSWFNGGSVGIGTAGPVQKLSVAGEITANEGTWGSGGYSFIQDGSQDTGMFSPSDGVIDFYDNQVHSIDLNAAGAMTLYSNYLYTNGSASNYGSISISGSKNGWYGINFPGNGTLMVSGGTMGFFNAADNAWTWRTDNSGNETVAGNSNIGGKLTVGTIDPVYSIDGSNYATYNAAMTGEKEETMGMVTLACAKGGGACSSKIDFNDLPKGSDLWLFGKATNLPSDLDNVVVVIAPSFDGKIWYNKDVAAGTLTIFGDQAGEVSYQLGAPRFDANQWPNTASSSEKANFIIND